MSIEQAQRNRNIASQLEKIYEADLPEIDKLAQSFGLITGMMLQYSKEEIELQRAMNDREALVKEQIKLGMIKHTRGIFNECHRRASGRRAWNE